MAKAEAIDTSVGPIGGQALLEGVMMRRGQSWGAAVRRQDGTIGTTSRVLPASLDKWRQLPLIRGVMALGETAALGTKATIWAATERGDESGDGYTRKGLFATVAIAIIGVVGIFGLLPAVLVKLAGIDGAVAFPVTEGMIRLAILIGYLYLLGRSPQVKRVFAYHGAEHMTIHAFEHRVSLTPEHIRTFSRRHPRCGTAFLLVVVITTMFVHAFMGHQSWEVLVLGRILGLPLVAGIAYEAIRFAGRHQHQLIGRIIMAPGSWLQGITTEEPTDDMIEVAVAALEATLAAEPLAPSTESDLLAAPDAVGSPVTMSDTWEAAPDGDDRRPSASQRPAPEYNDLVSSLEAQGLIASVPPIPKATRVEQLSNRRTLVLGLAGITMLVEILDIAGLVPGLPVGELTLSFSLLPSMALALACGSRLLGRSGIRRAAVGFWAIAATLLVTLSILWFREGRPGMVPALAFAALNEELVYRLAIPAVIAAALRLGNVRPNAARITGLAAAGLWFCLLPGHLDQISSPAGFLPYVSFAALSAFIVYRSGSILPMAVGHAISNLLAFLVFGAAVTADTRSFAMASVLCLLVLAYGRPRRLTVGDDGGLVDIQTGLAVSHIDLRDGQPALVELADGRILPVHEDMVFPDRISSHRSPERAS